jgi:hypothetical protein
MVKNEKIPLNCNSGLKVKYLTIRWIGWLSVYYKVFNQNKIIELLFY